VCMRKVQLVGLVAVMVPFAAMAADKAEIEAGRWEEVLTMTGMTVGGNPVPTSALPGGSTSRFVCISREEAIDPAKHFLSVGQNGKCTPNGMVVDGQINVIGKCSSDKFDQMLITGEGSYDLSKYHVNAKMTAKLKERPIAITMTVTGRHVGACDGTEK
jgi:hypothetical protein